MGTRDPRGDGGDQVGSVLLHVRSLADVPDGRLQGACVNGDSFA
jgi:hypothetical protein